MCSHPLLQNQMLSGHPEKAFVPVALTERNACAVAKQIMLLTWELPQDKDGLGMCFLTYIVLKDRGLPDAVDRALQCVLNYRGNMIEHDAVTLIGLVMDARSQVTEFVIGRDHKDALKQAIVRHHKRFAGVDETIVAKVGWAAALVSGRGSS